MPPEYTRQDVIAFCLELDGFDREKMREAAERLRNESTLPSHSEQDRAEYKPAYVVISKEEMI